MKNVCILGGMCGLLLITGCLKNDDALDTADQFEKDQELIDQYIAEHNLTTLTDTSGHELRYALITEGSGGSPELNDVLHMNIRESLLTNGKVTMDEDSIYIKLNGYIPTGLQVLLPYQREGGKSLLLIPSFYGYGNVGNNSGTIPPNSPLIYEIELHEVLSQFQYEQKKIDEYLTEENLLDAVDTSAVDELRYIINEEGTGEKPQVTDLIIVTYKGTILSSGKVFDSNTNVEFNLNSLIQGWKVLMPLVREKGKITMFLPSDYAYGANGAGTAIPAYTTLMFEVTLHEIVE